MAEFQVNFKGNKIRSVNINQNGGGTGAKEESESQKSADDSTEADGGPAPNSELYYTGRKGTPKVLLIGNIKFDKSKPLLPYKKDMENLKQMWKKTFGCFVFDEENLTRDKILEETKDFANKMDGNERYCAVFILSHGRCGDEIVGTDEKSVSFNEILQFFDNKNIKLQETPKLFFFQCCRGDGVDKGVQKSSSAVTGTGEARTLPEICDTLVMLSAQSDKVSIVDGDGSWMIKALVKVFKIYYEQEDVASMLTIVNKEISKRVVQCAPSEPHLVGAKCMSEYRSTLTAKLSLKK